MLWKHRLWELCLISFFSTVVKSFKHISKTVYKPTEWLSFFRCQHGVIDPGGWGVKEQREKHKRASEVSFLTCGFLWVIKVHLQTASEYCHPPRLLKWNLLSILKPHSESSLMKISPHILPTQRKLQPNCPSNVQIPHTEAISPVRQKDIAGVIIEMAPIVYLGPDSVITDKGLAEQVQ